ncbi:hypothetical protein IPH25_00565 [bacterium]|nr:MAG: hypothetical protein IPG37_02685 [bacterium]QQR61926.1 MAG: hypothetical protein IPH25_00565 [bacterium]
MNYKNSLLFIGAIAAQSSHVMANAADFSTDNPTRFAQQINEKLRRYETLDYQSLCDHLKNSFPSSEEAVQFLKKAKQAAPQTSASKIENLDVREFKIKELRQELVKLSLCFDNVTLHKQLISDYPDIITQVYDKDNQAFLNENLEKQHLKRYEQQEELRKKQKKGKVAFFEKEIKFLDKKANFLGEKSRISFYRIISQKARHDKKLSDALIQEERAYLKELRTISQAKWALREAKRPSKTHNKPNTAEKELHNTSPLESLNSSSVIKFLLKILSLAN